ncbi:MAG: hypothetical protein U0174_15555 [Polyangiaceae bacterium]
MLRLFSPGAVLALLAACSDVAGTSEPAASAIDAGDAIAPSPVVDGGTENADAQVAADAGDKNSESPVWTIPKEAPDCDPAKPFGAPVLVEGLPAAQLSPVGGTILGGRVALSPDERTIFFGMRTPGTTTDARIMIAERARRSDPFGPARALFQGAKGKEFVDPTVTSDGLTMYFKDYGRYGLWKVTRPNVASAFGSEVLYELGSQTISNTYGTFVSGDGSQLYGQYSLPGNENLYRFAANPPGSIGVKETNLSAGAAYGPNEVMGFTLSLDGRTLIYTKQLASSGDSKYYASKRASMADPFGPGVEITEFGTIVLQTSGNSRPQMLSADTCRLYRFDWIAGGNRALFVATRGK